MTMTDAELKELIMLALKRRDQLSPVERAMEDMYQKRSGSIGLSDFDRPVEDIKARIDAMPEFVILAELERLRKLHPNS